MFQKHGRTHKSLLVLSFHAHSRCEQMDGRQFMAKCINEDETFLLFGCLCSDIEMTIKWIGIGKSGRQQISFAKKLWFLLVADWPLLQARVQSGTIINNIAQICIPILYMQYILSCMQNLAWQPHPSYHISLCMFLHVNAWQALRPLLSVGTQHVSNT